jgi:hypothetical protein
VKTTLSFFFFLAVVIVGCSHGAQLCTRLISRVKLKGAVICAPACFELPETKAAIARGAKVNALVRRIIAAAEQKYGAPLEEVAKDPAKYGYTSASTEAAAVKCPVLFINGKNDDNSLDGVGGLYAESRTTPTRFSANRCATVHPRLAAKSSSLIRFPEIGYYGHGCRDCCSQFD